MKISLLKPQNEFSFAKYPHQKGNHFQFIMPVIDIEFPTEFGMLWLIQNFHTKANHLLAIDLDVRLYDTPQNRESHPDYDFDK